MKCCHWDDVGSAVEIVQVSQQLADNDLEAVAKLTRGGGTAPLGGRLHPQDLPEGPFEHGDEAQGGGGGCGGGVEGGEGEGAATLNNFSIICVDGVG